MITYTSFAGFDLISLLPFAAVFLIFYALVVRPQNKKMQEVKTMLSTLKKGQKVLTTSGIIGIINKVEDGDDEVTLEISDGVKVKFLKNNITQVLSNKLNDKK